MMALEDVVAVTHVQVVATEIALAIAMGVQEVAIQLVAHTCNMKNYTKNV